MHLRALRLISLESMHCDATAAEVNVQQTPMTHDWKQTRRSAEFHNTIVAINGSRISMCGSKMAYVVLFALICASAAFVPAGARETTVNARIYATDSTIGNITSVTAGQSFAANFIMTDRATNATIGTIMGFCVALRPKGQPCMCQSTGQLASGALQVISHG